jgi:anaerobic selenocysteine-containing dehydrogenase
VGECKSDEEVFQEISRRMGLDYGADSQEEILNQGLSAMGEKFPEYQGMDFEALKQVGYLVPQRTYYNYKTKGFATPSGKFELYSQRLKDGGGDPLPYWQEDRETPVSQPKLAKEFPLVLTTGRRSQPYFISNGRQIKSLRKQHPFPLVSLHPDTAAQFGIQDGDWVWIESPRGRITQKAMLVPELDPRVVNCEMGWWYPEAGAPYYGWDESNVNLLTIGEPPGDPFSGAYPLRGLLCRIAKNPDCQIEERYQNWMKNQ